MPTLTGTLPLLNHSRTCPTRRCHQAGRGIGALRAALDACPAASAVMAAMTVSSACTGKGGGRRGAGGGESVPGTSAAATAVAASTAASGTASVAGCGDWAAVSGGCAAACCRSSCCRRCSSRNSSHFSPRTLIQIHNSRATTIRLLNVIVLLLDHWHQRRARGRARTAADGDSIPVACSHPTGKHGHCWPGRHTPKMQNPRFQAGGLAGSGAQRAVQPATTLTISRHLLE